MSRYYDLMTSLTHSIVAFPGDPPFDRNLIQSLHGESTHQLCQFSMGNHTGTHIDFPAHVIPGGKTSSDYPLGYLIGDGVVVEVPDSHRVITADFIEELEIFEDGFVLFKTANSKISKQKHFFDNFVHFSLDSVEKLLQTNVRLLGIDYLSVHKFDATSLPVHDALLSNDILIVDVRISRQISRPLQNLYCAYQYSQHGWPAC